MKPKVMLALAILSISTSTWAATQTVRCSASHYLRSGGTEIRSTSIGFRNNDPKHSATIESLTIYDFFGIKIHESFAGDHPTNTDFPTSTGPVDITIVPPNAAYYLRTNHIWGNASIPDLGDGIQGNSRGFNMTVVVVFSTGGNPKLFSVRYARKMRERLGGPGPGSFFEGIEHSYASAACS